MCNVLVDTFSRNLHGRSASLALSQQARLLRRIDRLPPTASPIPIRCAPPEAVATPPFQASLV